MRQEIRAGTSAANSDTGAQLAGKINEMTEELYQDKHSHANKAVLDGITSTPATVESVAAIQSAVNTAIQAANEAIAAAQSAQEAAANAIPLTQKGEPGGVPTLGADGKVPAEQLPPNGGTANPADLISVQTPNALTLGNDNKLRVPPGSGSFDGDLSEVISTDTNNLLSQGTDDLLFVGALPLMWGINAKPATGSRMNWRMY